MSLDPSAAVPGLSRVVSGQSPDRPSLPPAVVPTPAAAEYFDDVSIQPEDLTNPVAKSISLTLQARWSSDQAQLGEINAIFRLNLPGKTYRRFDTALQMNEGCTILTSYYGGREACGISNDSVTKANPCVLESCALCTAIRSAFSNPLYGHSLYDGIYGPGIYTYLNPAQAHQPLRKDTAGKKEKCAIIQCRVVSQGSNQGYAARVDEAGVVFCTQPIAIIPTHLIILSISTKLNDLGELPTQGISVTVNEPSSSLLASVLSSPMIGQSSPTSHQKAARQLSYPTMRHVGDDPYANLSDDIRSSNRGPILFYEANEKYYEFTNFAPYPVVFHGKEYPTSEHLFQARKFLEHRPMLAEHIRRGSDDPLFAFNEASRLAPETRPDWKERSIEFMEEILELKFTQHPKLRRLLLDTGDRYLIENAGKYDDFWGNGANGEGRNELGLALMRLRTILKERENAVVSGKGKGKGRR